MPPRATLAACKPLLPPSDGFIRLHCFQSLPACRTTELEVFNPSAMCTFWQATPGQLALATSSCKCDAGNAAFSYAFTKALRIVLASEEFSDIEYVTDITPEHLSQVVSPASLGGLLLPAQRTLAA